MVVSFALSPIGCPLVYDTMLTRVFVAFCKVLSAFGIPGLCRLDDRDSLPSVSSSIVAHPVSDLTAVTWSSALGAFVLVSFSPSCES